MIFSFLILSLLCFRSHADVYEDLARATGGSVSRVTKEQFLKNHEDGKNRYDAMANAALLFSETLNFSGTKKYIDFPVDSETFGGLVVEVKGARPGDIKIFSPVGKEVTFSKDSGPANLPVEISKPDHRALIVPRPQKGLWKVVVENAEGILSVRLQSSLTIQKLQFLELAGRPGHQGLFPVKRSPKKGSRGLLEIRLGKYNLQSVELIDLNGFILSSESRLTLRDGSYFLDVKVPDVSFRVMIKGDHFQRVSSQIITPNE